MKKVCFLVSHLMSGSSELFDVLDQNPRVQGFRSRGPYVNMISIWAMTQKRHKMDNSAAIYMDELLFNHWLQTKDAYRYCKFVYVVRRPVAVLNELISRKLYTDKSATRYYCYRLRRICEMAKRTPGAVLLTWDDLAAGRGLDLVQGYLSLKQPLANVEFTAISAKSSLPENLLREAEESYERHLSFLYAQPLITCRSLRIGTDSTFS